jgi:hypothetical protein
MIWRKVIAYHLIFPHKKFQEKTINTMTVYNLFHDPFIYHDLYHYASLYLYHLVYLLG